MADDPTTAPETPVGDEAPVTDPNPNNASGGTLDDGDTPLGPKGEKALEAFKERARRAEAEAAQLKADLAKAHEATLPEQERAIAEARREAAEAAKAEVRGEILRDRFADKLAVATTGKLADPELLADPDVALKLLGLAEIPTTDTGVVDAGAISAAVARLIEAKPYLAADATSTPGPIDQGARTTSTAQPTIDEQIAEAEAARDWRLAGRLKNQKLVASRG